MEDKLESLRGEVRAGLGELRGDVKELTAALRELVRIDGETKRQNDALRRIGVQTDDHEKRLRVVERGDARAQADLQHHDRRVTWIYTIAGAALSGLLVYAFTRL